MEFASRPQKGVIEITLNPFRDERGFFMRTFDQSLFKEAGLDISWVQENHSCSGEKWTLRGLHFQLPPYSETKLIRCIQGAILDVFVDLRRGSPTFGTHDSIVLTATNNKMILLPKGFAHGFMTLTNSAEVLYKVDNVYNSQSERGLLWNDTVLNIEWPHNDPVISLKDRGNMTFETFSSEIIGIEI